MTIPTRNPYNHSSGQFNSQSGNTTWLINRIMDRLNVRFIAAL